MAKALSWVSLNVNGNATDPNAGASATFAYQVQDGDLAKTGTYTPPTPDYTQTVNAFWDAAITAIKAAEGIA